MKKGNEEMFGIAVFLAVVLAALGKFMKDLAIAYSIKKNADRNSQR